MPPKTRRDYEVGYGKPPRDARFKEGQSGNPRGRPPGLKNLKTLLSEALTDNERPARQSDKGCKSGVDFSFAAGLQDVKLHPLGLGGLLVGSVSAT